MFSSLTLKIKNLEHETIKNRTLSSADNSEVFVCVFGKCGQRQKEEEGTRRKEKDRGSRNKDTQAQAERLGWGGWTRAKVR